MKRIFKTFRPRSFAWFRVYFLSNSLTLAFYNVSLCQFYNVRIFQRYKELTYLDVYRLYYKSVQWYYVHVVCICCISDAEYLFVNFLSYYYNIIYIEWTWYKLYGKFTFSIVQPLLLVPLILRAINHPFPPFNFSVLRVPLFNKHGLPYNIMCSISGPGTKQYKVPRFDTVLRQALKMLSEVTL